jgi:hypothetical protein
VSRRVIATASTLDTALAPLPLGGFAITPREGTGYGAHGVVPVVSCAPLRHSGSRNDTSSHTFLCGGIL